MVLAAAGASAQPAAPQWGRELRESLGASANLPGLQNTLDLTWKRDLSPAQGGLRRGSHVAFGLSHAVSPSYTRLGLSVQVSPLSILDVRVGVEPALYHGASGSLLTFDSRTEPFDEDSRRARRNEAKAQLAGRAFVSTTLKARWRGVVASTNGEAEWWRAGVAESFFYEPGRDTLIASHGDTLLRTTSVLAYEVAGPGSGKIVAGLNHRLTYVRGVPQSRIERPGLVAAWTLGARHFGLREPTLAVNVFYYRDDPYKEGELGVQGSVRFALQ